MLLVAKDVEKAGNLAQLDAWYIREFVAADGHATAKTRKTEPKSEKQAKCDRNERMWSTVTDSSRLQAINNYPPLRLVFQTMQHQEIAQTKTGREAFLDGRGRNKLATGPEGYHNQTSSKSKGKPTRSEFNKNKP